MFAAGVGGQEQRMWNSLSCDICFVLGSVYFLMYLTFQLKKKERKKKETKGYHGTQEL
jgi:hypothetical protein